MAHRTRTFDLPLRCRCGRVRGVASGVAPSAGFRFVCYCRDCQRFARILERPDVLDAAGGTDIFQMPSARVALTAGRDAVRCLRFSRNVFRWYTGCCRTPIANTAGSGFPVVALIHAFIGEDKDLRDGRSGRRSVAFLKPRPPALFRRMRRRRRRCSFGPHASPQSSAGGCGDWASRTRSSTW